MTRGDVCMLSTGLKLILTSTVDKQPCSFWTGKLSILAVCFGVQAHYYMYTINQEILVVKKFSDLSSTKTKHMKYFQRMYDVIERELNYRRGRKFLTLTFYVILRWNELHLKVSLETPQNEQKLSPLVSEDNNILHIVCTCGTLIWSG